MRLTTVHAGDVVAVRAQNRPRYGEVRAKQRRQLIVAPWLSERTDDRQAITVSARAVLAHDRRRARASAAEVGDLVLVDIRGRRFHARVTARVECGELGLEPLTPGINYFHARSRDVQTRWAANRSGREAEGRRDD